MRGAKSRGDGAAMRTLLITTAALLLASTALAGCLGRDALYVSVSAPKERDAVVISSIFTGGSVLPGADPDEVSLRILKGGAVVYPQGWRVSVELEEGRGAMKLPYAHFVVDNGLYTVEARHEDHRAVHAFDVKKWVNWVYARPLDRGESLQIDLSLEETSGDPFRPVIASGDVDIAVFYENNTRTERGLLDDVTGGDPPSDRAAHRPVFTGKFAVVRASIFPIRIPYESFREPPNDGDYLSVEVLFHNAEALHNINVGLDPVLGETTPPKNWIHIRR